MTGDQYPQIKIRDVYFGTEGGVPFVNADAEIILNESGASVTARIGVEYSDEDTVAALKTNILEALHSKVAEAASIGLDLYHSALSEGMKSHLDYSLEPISQTLSL